MIKIPCAGRLRVVVRWAPSCVSPAEDAAKTASEAESFTQPPREIVHLEVSMTT
jgi:hypothetical protein